MLTRTQRGHFPLVAIAAAGLVLAACGREQAAAERARAGEDVYLSTCARCHQADGSGFAEVYPPLDGSPIVNLHDPRTLIDISLEGRGGMPGFRHSVSRSEMAQILTYIRRAWGNDAAAVSEREIG